MNNVPFYIERTLSRYHRLLKILNRVLHRYYDEECIQNFAVYSAKVAQEDWTHSWFDLCTYSIKSLETNSYENNTLFVSDALAERADITLPIMVGDGAIYLKGPSGRHDLRVTVPKHRIHIKEWAIEYGKVITQAIQYSHRLKDSAPPNPSLMLEACLKATELMQNTSARAHVKSVLPYSTCYQITIDTNLTDEQLQKVADFCKELNALTSYSSYILVCQLDYQPGPQQKQSAQLSDWRKRLKT